MVLIVGNNVVVKKSPKKLQHFLESSSRLRDDVNTFKAKPLRTVTETEGLLYVNQHEFAVTVPHDPSVKVLGSEDATTCHVIIIRDTMTNVTALAHFDIVDEEGDSLDRILHSIARLSDRRFDAEEAGPTFEISIVGGYADEHGKSEELTLSLLKELVESKTNFVLGLCCIGDLNTTYRDSLENPSPFFYGCAIEVSSGDIFPATFPYHGPENILRHVRISFNKDNTSRNLHELYECETGSIKIQPFRFQYFSCLHLWCQASAKDILENMSTSPNVEPDSFVPTLRTTMKFIIDNPNPMETIFKNGRPLVYKRMNRKWTKVDG